MKGQNKDTLRNNLFKSYQDDVSREGEGCTISWPEPWKRKDKPVRDIGNCNNRLLPGVFVTSREQKKIDLTSAVLTYS
jgi:hypothetical protein